jgi:holo-[acyl-carrier protein] synthase
MTPGRVGIDIVPLARVETLLDAGAGILRRHLTGPELTEAHRRGELDLACIAGKLAAKEAVFKLIRQPGMVLPWLAIRIDTDGDGGWPTVVLGGAAERMAAAAGLTGIDISIAHDGDYAIAAATAAVVEHQKRRSVS